MTPAIHRVALVAALTALLPIANAAAPAQEVARLGRDLTPIGAEKAGNEDGSIPEWTGGITEPPAGYKIGTHHVDPFASDQPLYTISAENLAEHRDDLSPGQIALLEKYATYKMMVYPTRRSASFRQRIYDYTIKNASTGNLVSGGDGVADVSEGFPFAIPQNGQEVVWNHKLRDKGLAQVRYNNQVSPTATGQFSVVRLREETIGLYWKEGSTLADTNNVLAYFYQLVEAPPRLAGQVLLVHETLDQVVRPRQAWVYNPGQRRVRKAPNIAYDNPGTASDGLRTNDMADMFVGALDRFEWKLIGKREMIVPYNSYKAHSNTLDYSDLVRPGHLNPDVMRYERHRVWVVEANLKQGVRHINKKRVFYFDEDSWQIVIAEHYDSAGNLWRVSEAHPINYYERPTFWATIEVHHDLKNGRYIASGLDNQEQINNFSFQTSADDFTPAALRKRGIR